MSLFQEADACAGIISQKPGFVENDLRLAFRILQKAHLPDLTTEQATTLFGEWFDRYRARRCLECEAARAGVPKLLTELDALKKKRTHLPRRERGTIDARIEEIGCELGAVASGFKPPPPPADGAVWV